MHTGFCVVLYCVLLALHTFEQVYYPHYVCFARVLLAPCFWQCESCVIIHQVRAEWQVTLGGNKMRSLLFETRKSFLIWGTSAKNKTTTKSNFNWWDHHRVTQSDKSFFLHFLLSKVQFPSFFFFHGFLSKSASGLGCNFQDMIYVEYTWPVFLYVFS